MVESGLYKQDKLKYEQTSTSKAKILNFIFERSVPLVDLTCGHTYSDYTCTPSRMCVVLISTDQ